MMNTFLKQPSFAMYENDMQQVCSLQFLRPGAVHPNHVDNMFDAQHPTIVFMNTSEPKDTLSQLLDVTSPAGRSCDLYVNSKSKGSKCNVKGDTFADVTRQLTATSLQKPAEETFFNNDVAYNTEESVEEKVNTFTN